MSLIESSLPRLLVLTTTRFRRPYKLHHDLSHSFDFAQALFCATGFPLTSLRCLKEGTGRLSSSHSVYSGPAKRDAVRLKGMTRAGRACLVSQIHTVGFKGSVEDVRKLGTDRGRLIPSKERT